MIRLVHKRIASRVPAVQPSAFWVAVSDHRQVVFMDIIENIFQQFQAFFAHAVDIPVQLVQIIWHSVEFSHEFARIIPFDLIRITQGRGGIVARLDLSEKSERTGGFFIVTQRKCCRDLVIVRPVAAPELIAFQPRRRPVNVIQFLHAVVEAVVQVRISAVKFHPEQPAFRLRFRIRDCPAQSIERRVCPGRVNFLVLRRDQYLRRKNIVRAQHKPGIDSIVQHFRFDITAPECQLRLPIQSVFGFYMEPGCSRKRHLSHGFRYRAAIGPQPGRVKIPVREPRISNVQRKICFFRCFQPDRHAVSAQQASLHPDWFCVVFIDQNIPPDAAGKIFSMNFRRFGEGYGPAFPFDRETKFP